MADLTERIKGLSAEKRELLEILLHERGDAKAWRQHSYTPPATPIEEKIVAVWSLVLGLQQIGIHDNYFELGGDSLQAITIVARLRQQGVRFTTNQLFDHPTIAELAQLAETSFQNKIVQEDAVGGVFLTPVQRWFFELDLPEPQHWNQAMVLELKRGYRPEFIHDAFKLIIKHHDALRLRFRRTEEAWEQTYGPFENSLSFNCIDLSAEDEQRQLQAFKKHAAEMQSSLDQSRGPLVRVAIFEHGPERPAKLLVVAHHLIVDGVSFRLVLEDLQTIYNQLSKGQQAALPPKTLSFQEWSRWLTDYAQSPEVQGQLDYWTRAGDYSWRLPLDFQGGVNNEASASTISVEFTQAETFALVQDIPSLFQAQTNEVLLAGLMKALFDWTGQHAMQLDVEGHGREEIAKEIDLSRTIGWFTSIFPVRIAVGTAQTVAGMLECVKQQLQMIPGKGIGYGLLRYLSGDRSVREHLRNLPQSQIVFNYLGQFDQVFTNSSLLSPAIQSYGSLYSPQGSRPYVLQVYGSVVSGRLTINFDFSKNLHRPETIQLLAGHFAGAARNMISMGRSSLSISKTMYDFPDSGLDVDELNHLFSIVDAGSSVKRESVEDIYQLSPIQEGILFQVLATSDPGLYLEQGVCTLEGGLDLASFEEAWVRIVERHPILRTAFAWKGIKHPVQIVLKQVKIPLTYVDWRSLSPEQQEEQFHACLRVNRKQGMKLHEPPLLRLQIMHTRDSGYRIIWAIHHLIHDAWATFLILKEVFSAYEACREKRAPAFGPTRPYHDYVTWIRRQNVQVCEQFWRAYLQGFQEPTAFPGKLQSAEVGEEPFGQLHRYVNEATTNSLEEIARQHHITLNSIVIACWSIVLARQSKQTDVIFGSVISGRPAALDGVESIVGPFINTLPMRVKVKPDESLLELAKELQVEQGKLQENGFTPLRQIRGWSEVPRGTSLFETLLVFQNAFKEISGPLGSLHIANVRSYGHSNLPLTVRVTPGRQLLIEVLFARARLSSEKATEVLRQLELILTRIAAQPITRVAMLMDGSSPSQQSSQKTPTLAAIRLAKPRPVKFLSSNHLVKTTPLNSNCKLPLLVEPQVEGVNLSEWVKENLTWIETALVDSGALLFRGFKVGVICSFDQFIRAISKDLLEYKERSTPRTEIGNRIYTSTEYPAHQEIAFHNEFSYAYTWPLKIAFHCVIPAEQGGETPIADSSKVYGLLDPLIRKRWTEKQVMYVRNYGVGIDLSWQEVFQTSDRHAVEEYCRKAPVEWEWRGENGLRTRQIRPAVAKHPKTGEILWFNQAHLFHLTNLEPGVRESMLNTFGEENLPRNAYYGDGTPIEISVLDEIRGAYREASVSFPWRQGDVLLLDNMRTAHGRSAFQGPRKIVVAMAESYSPATVSTGATSA